MRILINDYAGHPFQIELSRSLAQRGHDVAHLYCSSNSTPHGDLSKPQRGLTVYPVSTGESFEKYSLAKRTLDELRYGWRAARIQREWRPDVMVSSNVPLLSLRTIQRLDTKTPVVLWLQDIQSGLVSMVLDGWKVGLGRLVTRLERAAISGSAEVVAIADSLAKEAVSLGAAAATTTVIENWAPLADLPVVSSDNKWAARHDLRDKFVFLYSGTMGIKHRPELLRDLAIEFAEDPQIEIVVASEGRGADWLKEEAIKDNLVNLTCLPFQDFADLPNMLGTADVLLVVLEQQAGSFSIPSKILSYLCAGRPILGSLPPENSSTELLVEKSCAGIATTTSEEFVAAARRLRNDRSLRHQMGVAGRSYAESTFNIAQITDKFETILDRCSTGNDNTTDANSIKDNQMEMSK